MIKLIIFDLDGVLVDSKEVHFSALNLALEEISPKYVISKDDHIKRYDGLPTKEKLKLLTSERGLPKSSYESIWKRKQFLTIDTINSTIKKDEDLIETLEKLKEYKKVVASNSIKGTIDAYLSSLGISKYFDYIYSNEDISYSKPHPEIYWKAIISTGVFPKETLIIEDSHIGVTGALSSGAHVLRVKDRKDLTFEKINDRILKIEDKIMTYKTDVNILIPMAGNGSRFKEVGYTFPKPIIDVAGKPMIARVVDNIAIDGNHIFIIKKEHQEQYNIRSMLSIIKPNCNIIEQEGVLAGAAHTTLLAKDLINNDKPLIIANSDQIIKYSSIDWMYFCESGNLDGSILLFKNNHPKWSYARIDEHNNIVEVAEKNVISDSATVGIYYWRRGSDYVKYAEQMIAKRITTKGEYYVCPVYNEAIADGKVIKPFFVESMMGIGVPEDLEAFLRNGKF